MTRQHKICFVGTNRETCNQIEQQLKDLLGNWSEINTWCIEEEPCLEVLTSDIFIISTQPVFQQISHCIPPEKKIIIANRTLEIRNLEELLSLRRGTEVLLLSNHEKTVLEMIKDLEKLSINNVVFHPLWPGKKVYPKHIKVAVIAGQRTVPPGIERVIDLGVRTLNISTLVDLIYELNLPRHIADEFSARHISEIIEMWHRRFELAEQTESLKNRVEAILDTVDQGIIAIDKDNKVCHFNPTAEKMLGIKHQEAIDKCITELIPQISNIAPHTKSSETIQKIREHHYIINTTPILDAINRFTGVVISLKATNEVKELDSKVRRELKRKGNIAKHTFDDIAGCSPEISYTKTVAHKFATTNLTILIEGESGTGKELFAQAIHNTSVRKNAPFVALNFAALPDNLVESELFGYEDGAFTGARKGGKAGLFEESHTGTIFLDEIGDASLEVQKRLLRVLEEKEVRRVGGNTITPVDIRVIAATNCNLKKLVEEKKFREDLYFRICGVQIVIPPLRKRHGEILELMDFFTRRFYHREICLESHLQEYLNHYQWPGNVRELQNVVNFLCNTVSPGEVATVNHLPKYLIETSTNYHVSFASTPMRKDIAILIADFAKIGSLEPLFWVLSEIKKARDYDRPIGRKYIATVLAGRKIPCPEHKVRVWLRRLEQGGCITSNITRQGSKITKRGEDVLAFLETSFVNDKCNPSAQNSNQSESMNQNEDLSDNYDNA